MEVVKTVLEARKVLKLHGQNGVKVGFIPTMGALHYGHISLISRAKSENDFVVCSIFVNPAQFNDRSDLLKYPKTPDADHKLLQAAGCDLLFEPSEQEIYPGSSDFNMDFGAMERIMEGEFRPGHFKGVAKVVSRLFDIIQPYKAYFGEKDFQQLAIINELVRRKNYAIQIVGCPTLRDERGLALSSRNIHLNKEEYDKAPLIFETIKKAAATIQEFGIQEAKEVLKKMIEKGGVFKVQYIEFVNSSTLLPIDSYIETNQQRVCIAVLTSKTRLIDNVVL